MKNSSMSRIAPLLLMLATVTACRKELVCPDGQTDCGGQCVSLQTDPRHCGACDAAVGPLGDCVAGAALCAPDVSACGATCTDLAHDPSNCGGCDVACGAAAFCSTVPSAPSTCADACPAGQEACGRSSVELASDRFHCGACGSACAVGEGCRSGLCKPDLLVACYATYEVYPVTAALSPAGLHAGVPAGPTSIAVSDAAYYVANGYPHASVSLRPFGSAPAAVDVPTWGSDLQHVAVGQGVVMVTNAASGTLLFLTLEGVVLDELAMPRQLSVPNPRGFDLLGDHVWVALGGDGFSGGGQSVAKVSIAGLAGCVAHPGNACASVASEIDLAAIPAAFDAPGLPFPSEVIAAGGKVYVALANIKEDATWWGTAWMKPAGNGRLAVIDPGAGDAVSIVDLGAGCGNPGALALDGTTLWVSCGSFGYSDLAPPRLLPVELTASSATVGTPIDLTGIVPGKVAFCQGKGYVTDQSSGAVVRFDPATKAVEPPVTVCPLTAGDYPWAWASDVACVE
jgi:hypothetical protein